MDGGKQGNKSVLTALDRFNDEKKANRKRFLCVVRNAVRVVIVGFVAYQSQRIYDDTPNLLSAAAAVAAVVSKKPLLFDHERYQYHPPEPRDDKAHAASRQSAREQCGSPPSFDQYFHNLTNRAHRSVNQEDKTMYKKIFQAAMVRDPHKRRTYIELGAFDGLTESNTRFLDNCLNWDGILVEANPKKFPLLLKNRPHAHRLNFAPGCSIHSLNETIPFHSVPFTNGGVQGYAKAYPEGHQIAQVPCGSLTPVIQELAPNGVDFFSLDVEGSEPLIVKNIDFGKVRIDILMVESWNAICPQEPAPCETRAQTRNILQAAGYRRYSKIITKSDLFVHPQSTYLAQLPQEQYPPDL